MQGDSGEYMLLDPCVNLAGVLAKQNVMAMAEGKQPRDSVMISVFENDNNQQGQQQQGGWGQPQQPQGNQQQGGWGNQPPQQGGYNNNRG